jgi:hypothetical protein
MAVIERDGRPYQTNNTKARAYYKQRENWERVLSIATSIKRDASAQSRYSSMSVEEIAATLRPRPTTAKDGFTWKEAFAFLRASRRGKERP